MTQVTELIYENGVFKPTEPVSFPEHSRLRVVINPSPAERYYDDLTPAEQIAAKQQLITSLKNNPPLLNSGGRKLTREELHERD